jgi:hypothetical protein
MKVPMKSFSFLGKNKKNCLGSFMKILTLLDLLKQVNNIIICLMPQNSPGDCLK